MFARYASAVTTGTLMTFALLYVMQLMISLQPGAESTPRIRMVLGLTNVLEDTPVRKQEPKIEIEDLTTVIESPKRQNTTPDGDPLQVPHTAPRLPPGNSGIDIGAPVDGALVNMVRVSPVYPSRAEALGLEGHVIVQFDVDPTGQVVNVQVVESSNRLFEKAAITAAERFRYKPRVVDGVARLTTGIQNLFTFRMNE